MKNFLHVLPVIIMTGLIRFVHAVLIFVARFIANGVNINNVACNGEKRDGN